MPHRPDTWTDALFIYPLYHVNFLTSFMEWFRFSFQWRDSENRELRDKRQDSLVCVRFLLKGLFSIPKNHF